VLLRNLWRLKMIVRPKRYFLKNGRIYWHRLYYDLMPKFMTNGSLPGGSYNRAYYLVHPHKYVVELYDQAKWFIQRGYRGWADRDVWSVDWFLTGIMPGMLRQLKKTSHGYPPGMGMKRWQAKIEKMAEGFEIARRIQDYDFDVKDRYACRRLEREFHKRMDLFVKHFFNLWD
jgi:hypothetical protein